MGNMADSHLLCHERLPQLQKVKNTLEVLNGHCSKPVPHLPSAPRPTNRPPTSSTPPPSFPLTPSSPAPRISPAAPVPALTACSPPPSPSPQHPFHSDARPSHTHPLLPAPSLLLLLALSCYGVGPIHLCIKLPIVCVGIFSGRHTTLWWK